MAFLNRWLGSSPEKLLAKASRHLRSGRPAEALALARQAAAQGSAGSRPEADRMIEDARRGLIEHALEQAGKAEASEYLDDAIEWLQIAAGETEAEERDVIDKKIAALEQQAADPDEWAEILGTSARIETAEGPAAAPGIEDLDERFEAILGTLEEPIAELFQGRDESFRRSLVWIEEGHGGEALEVLGELLEASPDDPILHLTRGRALLQTGILDTAKNDFETAWAILGNDPLDRSGHFSVPSLWAEVALALHVEEELVERVGDLAVASIDGSAAADQPLVISVIEALLSLGRNEEARDLALTASQRFPGEPELARLLAVALFRLEARDNAIGYLEKAIAPSCSSGSCSRPPLHLPSVRTLATMYLESQIGDDRVEELIGLLARAQGGQLSPPDLPIYERWRQIAEHG